MALKHTMDERQRKGFQEVKTASKEGPNNKLVSRHKNVEIFSETEKWTIA